MFEILTCFSDSHEALFKRYFKPTLRLGRNQRLRVCKLPQGGSGQYRKAGWNLSMLLKIESILGMCRRGEPFAYSDCDVRWYKSAALLPSYMKESDIASQAAGIGSRGYGPRVFCAGFMLIANPRNATPFFEEVRQRMLKSGGDMGDMHAMITLFSEEPEWLDRVNIKTLPDQFWHYGLQSSKEWTGKEPLCPPKNIFLHHANWLLGGNAEKLRMMEQVRRIVHAKNAWFSRWPANKDPFLPKDQTQAV